MSVINLESETLTTVVEESPWRIIWRRFKKHRLAVAGMITISVIALACLFAPWIAPYDPINEMARDANNQILKNAPPSLQHLMGTDNIGRDIFSRLLYAGRISLSVAFIVTFFSIIIGVFIGAFSGYYGGRIDDIIQRFVEFLITLPLLPLLLAFSALMRDLTLPGLPREWSSAVIITIILVIFGWMTAAILVRGMVLSLRNQDFTEARPGDGLKQSRDHYAPHDPQLPGADHRHRHPRTGGVIIYELALSFLGFGIQPPVPTWGNMLNEYQSEMWTQPAKVFFPGLMIFICVLAFNDIGDGLRDAMDPRRNTRQRTD